MEEEEIELPKLSPAQLRLQSLTKEQKQELEELNPGTTARQKSYKKEEEEEKEEQVLSPEEEKYRKRTIILVIIAAVLILSLMVMIIYSAIKLPAKFEHMFIPNYEDFCGQGNMLH